jgi:hypothetical protein
VQHIAIFRNVITNCDLSDCTLTSLPRGEAPPPRLLFAAAAPPCLEFPTHGTAHALHGAAFLFFRRTNTYADDQNGAATRTPFLRQHTELCGAAQGTTGRIFPALRAHFPGRIPCHNYSNIYYFLSTLLRRF